MFRRCSSAGTQRLRNWGGGAPGEALREHSGGQEAEPSGAPRGVRRRGADEGTAPPPPPLLVASISEEPQGVIWGRDKTIKAIIYSFSYDLST